MRILIIPSWYPSEDAPLSGIFFLEQATALKKNGHDVQVLVPPGLGFKEKLKLYLLDFRQTSFSPYKGLQTARIKNRKPGPARNILSFVYFYCVTHFSLQRNLKGLESPDIIHAHGIFHGGILAAYLGDKWNVPVVLTEHNSAFIRDAQLLHVQGQYIRKTFQKINRILVVGQSLEKVFKSIAPHRQIEVIGNSIDASFFTLPNKDKPCTPFYFSTLAFLSENKGIDLIIKAFSKSFSQLDDVFLLIGGDGNLMDYLKDVSKSYGVDEKIFFMGQLNRNEVRELLWKAHVHVSASYFETFGINMVEALSCGIPVVATNSGGPQMFINPMNGILVPKGNVDKLSKAMLRVYNNYQSYD